MSKYTLITGASKGIGLELAKIFAKNKYNLILVARSEELLNNIKLEFEKDYNIKVEVIAIDLTKENASYELYEKTSKLDLRVEHLINNAGFGDYGNFLETSDAKNLNMIELNIIVLMQLCKLYASDMKKYGYGKILNVASIASFLSGPLMTTYYASKAFVLSFSEGLAREFKGTGITVTALCPGTTKTNFFDVASANESNLLNNLKPVSADKVARYGYKKMMKGKAIAIHGFKNRMMIFAIRFVPRSLVRNIAYKIQSKRKNAK